jgi:hypothetical protein
MRPRTSRGPGAFRPLRHKASSAANFERSAIQVLAVIFLRVPLLARTKRHYIYEGVTEAVCVRRIEGCPCRSQL